MDAGCGNGKYLNVRKDLIMEGCDRSIGLLNLSSQMNGNDHVLCDILNLPYKPNTFDGIISIAVIHHLSSSGHRLRAIQNLVQLLTIHGRALIYVWALEQEEGMRRKFEKQNVMVDWHLQNKFVDQSKPVFCLFFEEKN